MSSFVEQKMAFSSSNFGLTNPALLLEEEAEEETDSLLRLSRKMELA
jgi:hypothetical protein